MKKLFATLIAALFAAVTFSALAADTTATPADPAKPAKAAKAAKKHHKKVEHKAEEAAPAKK
ncbi:MAG TPA: hypothetical protein VGR01_03905 [Burkholderiales bacterium]|nr:hypothetical protein [Burkholderiales bacterium]